MQPETIKMLIELGAAKALSELGKILNDRDQIELAEVLLTRSIAMKQDVIARCYGRDQEESLLKPYLTNTEGGLK